MSEHSNYKILNTKSCKDNGITHTISMPKQNFQFNISLNDFETKSLDEKENAYIVKGIASSNSIDHYGTQMTYKALMQMAEQTNKGIVILPRHDTLHGNSSLAEWDEVIGRTIKGEVKSANVKKTFPNEKGFILEVTSTLYKDDPRTKNLIKRLKRNEPIGQSIGGWFDKVKVEEDAEGQVQRILVEDVTLDHIAITRAPANPDSHGLSLVNIRSKIQSVIHKGNIMNNIDSKSPIDSDESNLESTNTSDEKRNIDSVKVEVENAPSVAEIKPVEKEVEPTTYPVESAGDESGTVDVISEPNELSEKEMAMKELMEMANLDHIQKFMDAMKEMQAKEERVGNEEKEEKAMYEKMMEEKMMEEKAMYEKLMAEMEEKMKSEMEEKMMEKMKQYEEKIKMLEEKMMEKSERSLEENKVLNQPEDLITETPKNSTNNSQKRMIQPYQDSIPLAAEDVPWEWDTTTQDEVLGEGLDNWDRYKKAHIYMDENEEPETKGAYKLPIARMINGELRIVWRGVVAALAAIRGARGGVDIPEAEKDQAELVLKRYYESFEKEYPERSNQNAQINQNIDNKLDKDNKANHLSVSIQSNSTLEGDNMKAEDLQKIIETVTRSVVAEMNKTQVSEEAKTPSKDTNTNSTDVEELQARLQKAESLLSQVLDSPIRSGRHTSTMMKGVSSDNELRSLATRATSEAQALSIVVQKHVDHLPDNDISKLTNHQLKDLLSKGLRAAFMDGLLGTPVAGWQ